MSRIPAALLIASHLLCAALGSPIFELPTEKMKSFSPTNNTHHSETDRHEVVGRTKRSFGSTSLHAEMNFPENYR